MFGAHPSKRFQLPSILARPQPSIAVGALGSNLFTSFLDHVIARMLCSISCVVSLLSFEVI
jgi:hypothetical protein